MCSDAKCPVSSATKEDRRNRADIAASFQVEISSSVSKCFLVIVKKLSIVCLHQRVAVLHLEEKCERAIDWAMKLEPSIKHMVSLTQIMKKNKTSVSHLSTKYFFLIFTGSLWWCCFKPVCTVSTQQHCRKQKPETCLPSS